MFALFWKCGWYDSCKLDCAGGQEHSSVGTQHFPNKVAISAGTTVSAGYKLPRPVGRKSHWLSEMACCAEAMKGRAGIQRSLLEANFGLHVKMLPVGFVQGKGRRASSSS